LLNGQVVGLVDVTTTTEEKLLSLASGRDDVPQQSKDETVNRKDSILAKKTHKATTIFTASQLTGKIIKPETTISVSQGEIVGITGAPGAGHEEIPYLIAGALGHGQAQLNLDGKVIRAKGVASTQKHGIGLVPNNRLAQG